MKKLILFSLLSLNSFAGVAIITDLDDTIKMTNVANPVAATINGIFKKKVFAGISTFFKEARTYSEEVHILTASPPIIKRSVLRTLNRNEIEFDSVAFKNPLKRESKIAYKVRKIKEIMENSSHDFILIGDDVDKDPEVFEVIQKLYPDRILETYVHVVRGRPVPEGATTYWTSADLALHEMIEGRMDIISAEKVLEELVIEADMNKVIPHFADCPKMGSVWDWQLETLLAEKAAL